MSKLENWISTIIPDMDVLYSNGYVVCEHKDIKLGLQPSTDGASRFIKVKLEEGEG